MIFFSVRLYKLMHERNAYRLGLDAELAVGRELNHLMLDGFHVYHDFPADKYIKRAINVDIIMRE